MFYLIRHGKTDYTERNTKIYQGFGVNFASLTPAGVAEIKKTAKDLRLQDATLILSSPYTRALQSAAILSRELKLEIIVETDLHEWIANKNYIYETDERAEENYQEYWDLSGKYPTDDEKDWESRISLRRRGMAVLSKYRQYKKVIVVCHGMIIQSMGKSVGNEGYLENGEIVEFDF